MSDDITTAGPAPEWLREPILQPGERVAWWRGPREGRWLAWLKTREHVLFLCAFAGFFIFPFGGAGLAVLLGASDAGGGFFFGGLLGVGCLIAAGIIAGVGDKNVFHVLTDRRLLVIKGRTLAEQFDLELLRRLLAASDAAKPAGVPADEHVLDPSKVRPLLAPTSHGVTEMEPILRMLRAFGQLQGTPKG